MTKTETAAPTKSPDADPLSVVITIAGKLFIFNRGEPGYDKALAAMRAFKK